MNRALVFVLLTFSALSLAQAPQLKSGSTVYIEPMEGYETYLVAAFLKKNVPLVVVTQKDKADYTITSSVSQRAPGTPAVVINNTNGDNNSGSHGGYPGPGAFGRTSVSISVIDNSSSQVVFGYAVGKATPNQLQRTAESCAKHLKEFIEKPKK